MQNCTPASCQRGNDTGLITPHIFHGDMGGHATSMNAHGWSSYDTSEYEANVSAGVISFGNSGEEDFEGLSCSVFTGSDFSSVASFL